MSSDQRPPTRCVLFDLDGTLLDTGRDMAHALNLLRVERGLPPIPYAAIRPQVSHGSAALIALGFSVQPPAPEFEPLRLRFLELYAANLADQTRMFDGMEALLDEMESLSVPWGVVTNKPGWLTQPLLEALNLLTRAAVVVSGDTAARPKPYPDPLLHASRTVGVEPSHCAYIGDAARDIEAGLRAGMMTVVAAFGYLREDDDPSSWGAHQTVNHPDEIRQFLVFNGAASIPTR